MDRKKNLEKWRLSRRRFLEIAGLGIAASAVAATVPRLTRKGGRDAGPANQEVLAGEDAAGTETVSRRLRRWMMVIDLRKCDGCQSQDTPPQCTAACIEGHFVPEPMEWIEVYEYELPGEGTQFLPAPCQHCQNPPCVAVCPVGATFSTPEGVVLIDHQRCIGCRMCMAACPYDRRFFTWGDPLIPPEALLADYSPEHQVPLPKGVTAKCDFCPDVARAGRLPYCIQACPQYAIYYGDFEEDLATNGEEVVRVSRFLAEHDAYRLKEDLGTKPRVYYIPGHGELAGRSPLDGGRLPTTWPWVRSEESPTGWKRSGR